MGPQGVQGEQGIQGIQGPKGDKGDQGNPTVINSKIGASITLTAADVGALSPSDISNTLTTTTEGKVLDARQGKVLQDGKADKSTTVSTTLTAASWTGASAPYSYSLTVSGVTNASNQEVLPSLTITAEQLEALQGANIQDGGQATNSITIKAFGEVPTIDIPIRVIVRGIFNG